MTSSLSSIADFFFKTILDPIICCLTLLVFLIKYIIHTENEFNVLELYQMKHMTAPKETLPTLKVQIYKDVNSLHKQVCL